MAQNLQETLTDFTNRLNEQNRFSAGYVAEVNKCLSDILELLGRLVQRYNECQEQLQRRSQQFERDSTSSDGFIETPKIADASKSIHDAIEKIDEVGRNPNDNAAVLDNLRNTLIQTSSRLYEATTELVNLRQQLLQQHETISATFATLTDILANVRPNTTDLQELRRLCGQLRAELEKAGVTSGASVEPSPEPQSGKTEKGLLSSLMSLVESNKGEKTSNKSEKTGEESSSVVDLTKIYNKSIRRGDREAFKSTVNPSSIAQQGAPPGTFGTPKRLPKSNDNVGPGRGGSKTLFKKIGGTKKGNKTYKKNRKHKRGGFTYKLKPPSNKHSKTHKKRNRE